MQADMVLATYWSESNRKWTETLADILSIGNLKAHVHSDMLPTTRKGIPIPRMSHLLIVLRSMSLWQPVISNYHIYHDISLIFNLLNQCQEEKGENEISFFLFYFFQCMLRHFHWKKKIMTWLFDICSQHCVPLWTATMILGFCHNQSTYSLIKLSHVSYLWFRTSVFSGNIK